MARRVCAVLMLASVLVQASCDPYRLLHADHFCHGIWNTERKALETDWATGSVQGCADEAAVDNDCGDTFYYGSFKCRCIIKGTPCFGPYFDSGFNVYRLGQASVEYGNESSNVCPDGSVVIADAADCSALSGVHDLEYQGQNAWYNAPTGCFRQLSTSKTWFNKHPAGEGLLDHAVVCRKPLEGACLDKLEYNECLVRVWDRECDTPESKRDCKMTCGHCQAPCADKMELEECKTRLKDGKCNAPQSKEDCKETCGYCGAPVVYSPRSRNKCPDGSLAIADAASCSALSDAHGLKYLYSGSWASFPSGCIKGPKGGKTLFNNHPTGEVRSEFGVVCKQTLQASCADKLKQRVCKRQKEKNKCAARRNKRQCRKTCGHCEVLWPQRWADRRCVGKEETHLVSSISACQLEAAANRHTYYQYWHKQSDQQKCATFSSCESPKFGQSNPWKIYHQAATSEGITKTTGPDRRLAASTVMDNVIITV